MAHDLPPIRFASDPNLPHALRSLVEHARGDLPDAASLERFAAKLDASIAANAQPPEVDLAHLEAASAAPATPMLVKIAGTLALVGAVAGVTAYMARDTRPGPTAASPVASADVLGVRASTSASSSPPPALPTPPEAAPNGDAPPTVASTRQRVAARNSLSEAALLDSARAQLSRDPQRALQLTREHAARFPRGGLIQEREVIAIEALRRLGKAEAARKRGAEFGQQFPDSAHQSKIDQTLER